MIELIWIPRSALGPFRLGESLESASNYCDFEEVEGEYDDIVRMRSYISEDHAIRLEVRDGLIESISSEKYFIFSERNLIGMSLAGVEGLIGRGADEIDPVDFSEDTVIADFVELGLQLVVVDGRVDSATCY